MIPSQTVKVWTLLNGPGCGHTQHNQTNPCQTKHITLQVTLFYSILICITLHCSKPGYTDKKSHHMVVVVVVWWWCGGVVYLTDYRTTPV